MKRKLAKVLAPIAAVLTVFGGMAYAGALPRSMQHAVSHTAGTVGLDVPRGDDDQGEDAVTDDTVDPAAIASDDQGENSDDQGESSDETTTDDQGENDDSQGDNDNQSEDTQGDSTDETSGDSQGEDSQDDSSDETSGDSQGDGGSDSSGDQQGDGQD